MHANVLKFHILISHEKKIADTYYFSYQDYAPFLSYGSLKKIWIKACLLNISKTSEARALKFKE